MALMLRDSSHRSCGGGRVCAPICAAMLLSMRVGAPRILANEAYGHFGRTKPSGENARERRTNLRLHEMSAGVVSLFPACYLQ